MVVRPRHLAALVALVASSSFAPDGRALVDPWAGNEPPARVGAYLEWVGSSPTRSAEESRAAAMREHTHVQACWRRHPLPPGQRGALGVRLLVRPTGTVVGATQTHANFDSPALTGCVLDVASRVRFTPQAETTSVELWYSFYREP